MARIGYLLLHEGRWNGKQVVPSDYVREAATTRESARFPAGDPPRLPLSVLDTPATGIAAIGFGGQSVVVFLKLDLVIVARWNWRPKTGVWRQEAYALIVRGGVGRSADD